MYTNNRHKWILAFASWSYEWTNKLLQLTGISFFHTLYQLCFITHKHSKEIEITSVHDDNKVIKKKEKKIVLWVYSSVWQAQGGDSSKTPTMLGLATQFLPLSTACLRVK